MTNAKRSKIRQHLCSPKILSQGKQPANKKVINHIQTKIILVKKCGIVFHNRNVSKQTFFLDLIINGIIIIQLKRIKLRCRVIF